jgi:hypothetical protein
MLSGILSGASWFGVFLIVHVALLHARPWSNRFEVVARVYLATVFGHLATSAWLCSANGSVEWGRFFVAVWSGLMVMASLCVLYLPFFFTIVSSLSVQTMVRLNRSPQGKERAEALRRAFASERVVSGRLDSMVANGWLTRRGDRYFTTEKGRSAAGVFRFIKRAWRLGPGG